MKGAIVIDLLNGEQCTVISNREGTVHLSSGQTRSVSEVKQIINKPDISLALAVSLCVRLNNYS